MRVARIGTHTIRLVSGLEASKWVREPTKRLKTYDAPQMQSGLNVAQSGYGSVAYGGLLYLSSNGNNLMHSPNIVFLTASCSSFGHGLSLTAGEGWSRSIALLCARDLVPMYWVKAKDEYRLPYTYREVKP